MAGVIPAELGSACARVRLAGPADAVIGAVPSYVASPVSTQEAAAVLRAAAGLGLAVVARGGGTRLDWGGRPSKCDLVVETGLMDTVLEHAAGDLVARVQAGVRLDRLAEVLGAAGQRLALDPPGVGSGTAGGLIATGVAGPLRLRFGAPRDLLIGITVVRADGTVARAGGRVVKNVAGYDIGKLMAGSYGTLGLITEATFRLHPRPPAAAYVSLSRADPEVLLSVAGSVLAPAAAELDWPARNAPIDVTVLLEGDADGVAERAARMRELLAGYGEGLEVRPTAPAWWGCGPAAQRDGTAVRIAFWPAAIAGVLRAIRAAAERTGLDPAVGGSAAAGVLHAALPGDARAAAVARFVADLRAALGEGAGGPAAGLGEAAGLPAGAGASAVVLHAPPAVRDVVDLWGPVPSLPLMRSVKDQFDPEHRLAPGRLPGGI